MLGMFQAGMIVTALMAGAPGQEAAAAPDEAVQTQAGQMVKAQDRTQLKLHVADGTGDAVQTKLQKKTQLKLHTAAQAGTQAGTQAQVQDKVQARQKLMTGTPAPVGSGPHFVDLDGDGIPDGGAALGASRGTHRGRGMMKANVGSGNGQRGANVAAQQGARGARNGGQGGAGFVDANGDGVCDNGGAATSGGAGGISGGNGSGGAGGNGSGNGR